MVGNGHLDPINKEFYMTLTNRLSEYISACFTGLWVQSHEHEDAFTEIAQMCRDQQWRLATWDVDQGLKIPGQGEVTPDAGGTDPLAAIRAVNALAAEESSAILVLVNFHRFLQSAEIVQALAGQIAAGKANRTFIVVLSPVVADAMAPCVLHCDEIEKALSGVAGSGQTDSGVSARMFGSLLTWLRAYPETSRRTGMSILQGGFGIGS
jgi:hypothetical protein